MSESATQSTDAVPFRPDGFTTLTPFLCVPDGNAAIDFYTTVFGATLLYRMDTDSGGVAHAELDFGVGRLQLGDAQPDYGIVAPSGDDAVSVSIALYCPDADAVVKRAVEHGAVVRAPVSTFVTGDRFGSVRDPFGHRWSVMTRVENVSDEEAERRLAEWAAGS